MHPLFSTHVDAGLSGNYISNLLRIYHVLLACLKDSFGDPKEPKGQGRAKTLRRTARASATQGVTAHAFTFCYVA